MSYPRDRLLLAVSSYLSPPAADILLADEIRRLTAFDGLIGGGSLGNLCLLLGEDEPGPGNARVQHLGVDDADIGGKRSRIILQLKRRAFDLKALAQ